MKYTDFVEIIQNELYDQKEKFQSIKSNYSLKGLALDSKPVREALFTEALDSSDYAKLRDIIRAEIAALLFDLFKKRSVWL